MSSFIEALDLGHARAAYAMVSKPAIVILLALAIRLFANTAAVLAGTVFAHA